MHVYPFPALCGLRYLHRSVSTVHTSAVVAKHGRRTAVCIQRMRLQLRAQFGKRDNVPEGLTSSSFVSTIVIYHANAMHANCLCILYLFSIAMDRPLYNSSPVASTWQMAIICCWLRGTLYEWNCHNFYLVGWRQAPRVNDAIRWLSTANWANTSTWMKIVQLIWTFKCCDGFAFMSARGIHFIQLVSQLIDAKKLRSFVKLNWWWAVAQKLSIQILLIAITPTDYPLRGSHSN